MFNPILRLSELEVECIDEDNPYGASVVASVLHFLITGRSFGNPFQPFAENPNGVTDEDRY